MNIFLWALCALGGEEMKLAVTGKGGVGKTTVVAGLSRALAKRGIRVLAIDADPASNLAQALGFSPDQRLTPIAEMKDLIAERTGSKPGSMGGFFKLNPRVDDLPEKYFLEKEGIRLMVMGTVQKGGGGCVCPENVLVRTLVSHLLLRKGEAMILDMEAGVEHLGRATADSVDALLIVVEPTARSLGTAEQIKALAGDLKLTRLYLIGSKVQNEDDRAFIRQRSPGLPVLGFLPIDPGVREADRTGAPVFDAAPALAQASRDLVTSLEGALRPA